MKSEHEDPAFYSFYFSINFERKSTKKLCQTAIKLQWFSSHRKSMNFRLLYRKLTQQIMGILTPFFWLSAQARRGNLLSSECTINSTKFM